MKLILLLLIAAVQSNTDVSVTCAQCGAVACLTYTGGGFNGQPYATNSTSCAAAGNYPIETNFQCSSACPSNC
jgi:hypothetical protein